MVGKLLATRQGSVRMVKVDAHKDYGEAVVPGAMEFKDFMGNAMADCLAGAGASMAAVPHVIEEQQRIQDARTYRVLKRLLAVNMFFVKKCPARSGAQRPKRQKEARTAFQRMMEDSGHDLGGLEGCRTIGQLPTTVACITCSQMTSRKTIKAWLKHAKCTGQALASATHGMDVARPPKDAAVRIGRVDLHRTHLLHHRLGLWWCGACGYYTTAAGQGARSSAKLLRLPCRARGGRPATGAGKGYLERIAMGKMPKSGLAWPLPAHATSLASDPFAAFSKFRVATKSTVSLTELEDWNLPDPVHECDHSDPEEEQDPFDLGALDFDDPGVLS